MINTLKEDLFVSARIVGAEISTYIFFYLLVFLNIYWNDDFWMVEWDWKRPHADFNRFHLLVKTMAKCLDLFKLGGRHITFLYL
jgi:hypothetical protein